MTWLKTPIAFDYSRDNEGRIFWQSSIIKGADADSFTVLNQTWARDKKNIYFKRSMMPADPASFEVLNDTWARDKKNVYVFDRKLAKADRASFQVLNCLYAKDKNHAFYLDGKIKEADGATFVALDSGEFDYDIRDRTGAIRKNAGLNHTGFARDKNYVFHYLYSFGKPCILRGADLESFQVLKYGYGKDKNHVYCGHARVKQADPETFETVGHLWGRDKKRVFYGGALIRGADPASFELFDEHEFLCKDKNRYYFQAQIATEEDMKPRGVPPLRAAAEKGDLEEMKRLLASGADPNGTDPNLRDYGDIPLVWACRKGAFPMVQTLVEAGADVNLRPYRHSTLPLYIALNSNHVEIAEFLVQAGAEIDARIGWDEDETLLNWYAILASPRPAVVEFFKSHGFYRRA